MEIFADMTGFLAISLVVGFALAGPAGRPVIVRLGKLIGLAYLIAIVLAVPYIAYMLGSKPPRPVTASRHGSGQPGDTTPWPDLRHHVACPRGGRAG